MFPREESVFTIQGWGRRLAWDVVDGRRELCCMYTLCFLTALTSVSCYNLSLEKLNKGCEWGTSLWHRAPCEWRIILTLEVPILNIKYWILKPGLVVRVYNPSTPEPAVGGLPTSRPLWMTQGDLVSEPKSKGVRKTAQSSELCIT